MDWIIIDSNGAQWVAPSGERDESAWTSRFESRETAVRAAKKVVHRTSGGRLYVARDAPEWHGADDILVDLS